MDELNLRITHMLREANAVIEVREWIGEDGLEAVLVIAVPAGPGEKATPVEVLAT